MNFHVALKKVVDDSYDIEIGYKLEDKLVEDIENGLVGEIRNFAIITDSIVEKLYAKNIVSLLKARNYKCDLFVFEAGEKSKTRKTKEVIEDAMLEKGYRRDCCIIAIGGGVVTDLAGFIAGTYGRGIPFINYSTTLLGAADASVGGKTAVDTELATNLIGLIYQPKKVYIDINTWTTLPRRQLSSGLCETIKHACIADKEFFKFIEDNIEKIFDFDKAICTHVAESNCRIKYEVVMKDEKENNLREILNLGHTVGRAIETVSDYKLLHGEALSIGIVAEVILGEKLGYVTLEEKERVINLLENCGLPIKIPSYINKEELVKKLYTDKKVRNGNIRFVFQKGIGSVMEFEGGKYATVISEEEIKKVIEVM